MTKVKLLFIDMFDWTKTKVCYDYYCDFCKLKFGEDFVGFERYVKCCRNNPNLVITPTRPAKRDTLLLD